LADLISRFLVGGLVVTVFALIGSSVKPKSLAGLFSAAPSVSLATLALTASSKGTSYAAVECRSMIAGAVALGVYSLLVCWLLVRRRRSPGWSAVGAIAAWFVVAGLLVPRS
jgi:uncharacterized membrane protein (GlpM family)